MTISVLQENTDASLFHGTGGPHSYYLNPLRTFCLYSGIGFRLAFVKIL